MTHVPDFGELVGEDLPPEERERLQRVHDMLLEAGPPPELSPALGSPRVSDAVRAPALWQRRRLGAVLTLAAALAAVLFGAGYLAGHHGRGFKTDFAVPMTGRGATAVIRVGELDPSGNWPLLLEVHGLKPLPEGRYYDLLLTRKKGEAVSCGTFRVHSGTTVVRLNAPYRLTNFNGWVVRIDEPGSPIVMRTPA